MVLLWLGERVIHLNEHKRAHIKHIGLDAFTSDIIKLGGVRNKNMSTFFVNTVNLC
jgi:hypothetical protein